MKILYNEETLLSRCQDFLPEYAELLNRIGEEIPDELEKLEEELSWYLELRADKESATTRKIQEIETVNHKGGI